MRRDMEKSGEIEALRVLVVLLTIVAIFSFGAIMVSAAPNRPTITHISNETYGGNSGGSVINISGGYVATINLSTSVQNPHWKAFVGWVNGAFTLQDASGSTIYDWDLTSTNGQVYATRNSSTIQWSSIACATPTQIESENVAMNHSNVDDNITATFDSQNSNAFYVGAIPITLGSCSALNTYVDNVSQSTDFEEVVLSDSSSIVYSTLIEDMADGYDENDYDFQMLVPENGAQGFEGATAYYLYVEVN